MENLRKMSKCSNVSTEMEKTTEQKPSQLLQAPPSKLADLKGLRRLNEKESVFRLDELFKRIQRTDDLLRVGAIRDAEIARNAEGIARNENQPVR